MDLEEYSGIIGLIIEEIKKKLYEIFFCKKIDSFFSYFLFRIDAIHTV